MYKEQRSTRHRRALTAAIAVAAAVGLSGAAVVSGATAARPTVSQTDATAGAPAVFIPVTPLRVLDTRPAPFVTVGVLAAGKLGPNSKLDLQLAGDGKAIPANATAALLNITIDQDASSQSFVTVWPTGETQPLTSANNALPGLVASNSMLAKLGANGSISIYNQTGSVNIIVDVVGYTVPLSNFGGPGANLISGAIAPANSVGSDGDFYVDTTHHVLYGPKTAGVWPAPGQNLGPDQGAASAYSNAPLTVTSPSAASVPIAFATAGPMAGTVTRTNSTTFTVSDTGLYTVDYHVAITAGAAGTISVYVDGVSQGPTSSALTPADQSDSVLVNAVAGNTVELRFTPTVIGTSVTLSKATIVVQESTNG